MDEKRESEERGRKKELTLTSTRTIRWSPPPKKRYSSKAARHLNDKPQEEQALHTELCS